MIRLLLVLAAMTPVSLMAAALLLLNGFDHAPVVPRDKQDVIDAVLPRTQMYDRWLANQSDMRQ